MVFCVLKFLKSLSDKILILLSNTLLDKACFKPNFLTFLFNLFTLCFPFALGPCAIPPPTNIGAVILPCRAPPDPFCGPIFFLEPATSPLVFV